jgi:hypothetical protein
MTATAATVILVARGLAIPTARMATTTSWNTDRHPSPGTAKLAPDASVLTDLTPKNNPTATAYQRGTLAAPVQFLAGMEPLRTVIAILALMSQGPYCHSGSKEFKRSLPTADETQPAACSDMSM